MSLLLSINSKMIISNVSISVRGLLDIGINPCAADNRQRTALHFAAAGGHTEVGKCEY